jgi:hypothetical protein
MAGRPTLEERLKLGDGPQRTGGSCTAPQHIRTTDLLGEDGALQLPQRQESEILARNCANQPAVCLLAGARLGLPNLELVPAVGTPNRRAAPADERVVEFIFSFAAFALDVHERVSRAARARCRLGPRFVAFAERPEH